MEMNDPQVLSASIRPTREVCLMTVRQLRMQHHVHDGGVDAVTRLNGM